MTKDVPAHALVAGVPARRMAWVGFSGQVLEPDGGELVDPADGTRFAEVEGRLEPR